MNVQEKLIHHFAAFITDHKKTMMEKVLSDRTKYVTVVLENIYQSQNASAVLRTCECLGIQDIHIVENTAKYELNVRVLKGADKWLTLHRYRTKNVNNTKTCFERLRAEGYRIFVADPEEGGLPIGDVDVASGPVALVFGNELRGASAYAIENSDARVRIPMVGFTESLNISVSVAICLNTVFSSMANHHIAKGLSELEKTELRLDWYRKTVKRSQIIEKEFLRTIQ